MEIKLTKEEGLQVLEIIKRATFQGSEVDALMILKQNIIKQLNDKTMEEKTLPLIDDIIAMYPYPEDLPVELQYDSLMHLYKQLPDAVLRIRLALMNYIEQINRPEEDNK